MRKTVFHATLLFVVLTLSFAGFGCRRVGKFFSAGDSKALEQKQEERREAENRKAAHEERFSKAPTLAVDVTVEGFSPKELRAKVGPVRLNVRGAGAIQTFRLPDYSVNTVVRPGESLTFDLELGEAGTHDYYLDGTSSVRGHLIVE